MTIKGFSCALLLLAAMAWPSAAIAECDPGALSAIDIQNGVFYLDRFHEEQSWEIVDRETALADALTDLGAVNEGRRAVWMFDEEVLIDFYMPAGRRVVDRFILSKSPSERGCTAHQLALFLKARFPDLERSECDRADEPNDLNCVTLSLPDDATNGIVINKHAVFVAQGIKHTTTPK